MEILKKYTNPSTPGSFSGQSTFIRELKRNKQFKEKVIDKKVKEVLKNSETYTLHRPIRKKFIRNKIIVSGIDDTFQADLIDLTNIANFNDENKFILTCIDVFSKFAWAIPIKNKNANSVFEAFKIIFSGGRIPKRIQTDEGNEFLNKVLKKYFQSLKIKLYTLNSEMKASIVERFNRTIKEKMWRYFTFKQNYRYIDILDDLIKSYNNTYHRTIKMSPSDVNEKNEKKIWHKMYDNPIDSKSISFKFKVGDLVRISKAKSIFQKGYTANWSREIFKIKKCLPRNPPVYIISDDHPTNPEIIDGIFYEEQLQKILKDNDIYYVEQVVSERNKKGKKEVLIKWLGYPDKFNTWEPASNFVNNKISNYFYDDDDKERIEFSI